MKDQEPILRVVRGDPSAEELAGLMSVLLASAGTAPPSPPRSYWLLESRPGARVGKLPARPGRHGWRASALPR